jgi:23S rRNA pseudouridine2605 synthase
VSERLQKVLAAAGITSRREAEQWIKAGRVAVNGKPATLGQKVAERDVISVDGRRLRLERAAPTDLVLLYHRAPGESLKPRTGSEAEETSTYDRLPAVRGRRWLPLSPLAPLDGGLEIFTTDGTLRAAASRHFPEIPVRFSIRLIGDLTEDRFESLKEVARTGEPAFEIDEIALGGGEARNHWVEVRVRRGHGKDLRRLFTDQGFEVTRILRTSFGPVTMDRALSRGRHRELEGRERDALYTAVGLPAPSAVRRELKERAERKAPSPGRRNAGPTRRGSRGPRGTDRSR